MADRSDAYTEKIANGAASHMSYYNNQQQIIDHAQRMARRLEIETG